MNVLVTEQGYTYSICVKNRIKTVFFIVAKVMAHISQSKLLIQKGKFIERDYSQSLCVLRTLI